MREGRSRARELLHQEQPGLTGRWPEPDPPAGALPGPVLAEPSEPAPQLCCSSKVHTSESAPGEGGITLVEGASILRLPL